VRGQGGVMKLRDLLERLKQQRQQPLQRHDLNSIMDDIKKRLDEIVAAERADMVLRLHGVLKPRLAAEGVLSVYESLERPLVAVLGHMERGGISIDRNVLSRLSGEFAQEAAGLEAEINTLAGETVNPGSPKQLGDILFGQLGLLVTTTKYLPNAAPDLRIHTQQPYFALTLSGKDQLQRCEPVWGRHSGADRLRNGIAGGKRQVQWHWPLGEDLIGLEVVSAEEVAPVGEYVYDFSVEGDENFVCGSGGLCAHNTDADVDGAHIRTLLLTFFFRQMRQVITEGYLYIAQPPLFRVMYGKENFYAYTVQQRDAAITEIKNKHKNSRDPDVTRYKGLGEMNPEQLWDTTMNPATRTLLRVNMDDAAQADEIFDMLMGDQVPPRKKFIQTHAKYVRNLDV